MGHNDFDRVLQSFQGGGEKKAARVAQKRKDALDKVNDLNYDSQFASGNKYKKLKSKSDKLVKKYDIIVTKGKAQ